MCWKTCWGKYNSEDALRRKVTGNERQAKYRLSDNLFLTARDLLLWTHQPINGRWPKTGLKRPAELLAADIAERPVSQAGLANLPSIVRGCLLFLPCVCTCSCCCVKNYPLRQLLIDPSTSSNNAGYFLESPTYLCQELLLNNN